MATVLIACGHSQAPSQLRRIMYVHCATKAGEEPGNEASVVCARGSELVRLELLVL